MSDASTPQTGDGGVLFSGEVDGRQRRVVSGTNTWTPAIQTYDSATGGWRNETDDRTIHRIIRYLARNQVRTAILEQVKSQLATEREKVQALTEKRDRAVATERDSSAALDAACAREREALRERDGATKRAEAVSLKAQALLDKLVEIDAHPSYHCAFGIAYAHGHHYTGPSWSKDVEALRAALGGEAAG